MAHPYAATGDDAWQVVEVLEYDYDGTTTVLVVARVDMADVDIDVPRPAAPGGQAPCAT